MSGKLAQKRADKEADIILTSLKKASEAAIATTLKQINDQLRADTPLMYHVAALLQNEEWKGVLRASIDGVEEGGDKPEPTASKRKLRAGSKKFSHLAKPENEIALYMYRLGFRSLVETGSGLRLALH